MINFESALTALKTGWRIAREHDFNNGEFLFLLPAGEIPVSAIHDPTLGSVIALSDKQTFTALPSIRKRNSDGSILTGWTPSLEDLFAEDWVVFEQFKR